MPILKLSNSSVDSKVKQPETGKVIYWDTELKGFGLRATPTALTYIVQGRVSGKLICVNVGRHGVFTTTEAREQAKVILGQMAQGINLNEKKKAEEIETVTLQTAFSKFLEERNLREKTKKIYQGAMDVCFPDWKELPMCHITKDMIVERHKKISNKRGPRGKGEALANQAFRFLRTLFNYAIVTYEVGGKQVLPDNPVKALSQRDTWNKNRKRKDVIAIAELKSWYEAVKALRYEQSQDLLLLYILTGLRLTEGLTLKWEYVNMRAKTLTVPAEVVKTDDSLTLPLSNKLLELFERRGKVRQIGNPYVFLSEDKTSHVKEVKTAISSVIRKSGVKFSPHTLRRTFITVAETLEIPHYSLKALINHKVSDITADYIQITPERLRKPMQQITDYMFEQFTREDEVEDAL